MQKTALADVHNISASGDAKETSASEDIHNKSTSNAVYKNMYSKMYTNT